MKILWKNKTCLLLMLAVVFVAVEVFLHDHVKKTSSISLSAADQTESFNIYSSFKWIFNNHVFQYSVYIINNATDKHIESKEA